MTDTTRPNARFDLYSHFIKITDFSPMVKIALQEYCYRLTQWGVERRGQVNVRVEKCVYRAITKDETEMRLHINQLEDVLRHLESYGIVRQSIQMVRHELYKPVEVSYEFRSPKEPRDHQPMIIEYLTAPPKEGYAPSKVVTLQTGKGKGFVTFKSLVTIGQRALLTVKGMYAEKWKLEYEEMYHYEEGDVLIVDGSDKLRKLIGWAREGSLKAKLIIITLGTMRMYMQTYEAYGEALGYDLPPEELWELLGIGVHLTDEAHMEHHCVFRIDLFSHVPLAIFLSATLVSDDQFMNQMYAIQWPEPTRSPHVPYHKYIRVYNIWYTVDNMKGIRYKNFMKQYNHPLYEQSIMKRPQMLDNYYEMNKSIMNTLYFNERQVGQKALMFCATKELCTEFRDRFQRDYPDLKIGRYIDVDPKTVLAESDMVVTTLKSAGTAIDIPNLTRVLCTHNVSSKQANEQAVGRLREIKDWPDETPIFTFISARNVDTHCKYAAEKSGKLDGKVLSYQDFQSRFRI